MTSQRPKYRFGHFCASLNKFLKTYDRSIQEQTKCIFKILQILVVTYDMVVLLSSIDVVQTTVVCFLS